MFVIIRNGQQFINFVLTCIVIAGYYSCILHKCCRILLSLLYDILKLLSNKSLSYVSDYLCLLELVTFVLILEINEYDLKEGVVKVLCRYLWAFMAAISSHGDDLIVDRECEGSFLMGDDYCFV